MAYYNFNFGHGPHNRPRYGYGRRRPGSSVIGLVFLGFFMLSAVGDIIGLGFELLGSFLPVIILIALVNAFRKKAGKGTGSSQSSHSASSGESGKTYSYSATSSGASSKTSSSASSAASKQRVFTTLERQEADVKAICRKRRSQSVLLICLGALVGFFGIFSSINVVRAIGAGVGLLKLLWQIITSVFLLAGSVVTLGSGINMNNQAERFEKYSAIISDKEAMLLRTIADAVPTTVEKACKDLQKMITLGAFGSKAYLNMSTGNFMRTAAATPEEDPLYKAEKASASQEELDLNDGESVVREIRHLNDLIDDPDVSERIDRLEELTAGIFQFVSDHPAQRSQVSSFMEYYLPTTLKLLSAYDKLEDQAACGENISAAKANIESILDTLVNGFSQQLDKLFAAETMDISSDIKVLEQMMERDGLKEGKNTFKTAASGK